jgi:hypothetical protein
MRQAILVFIVLFGLPLAASAAEQNAPPLNNSNPNYPGPNVQPQTYESPYTQNPPAMNNSGRGTPYYRGRRPCNEPSPGAEATC